MAIVSGIASPIKDEKTLLINEKYEAIRAAKELGYGEETVNRIRKAKSDYEVTRALTSAREQREICYKEKNRI